MKSAMLKHIVMLFVLAMPFVINAQTITNVNTSSQNCQGDTIAVLFSVTAPLNAGNQFTVELSTSAGAFPGTLIQITPLTAFNIGGYSMDCIIPPSTSQGVYKIRVLGSNPIVASDTLNNIIVGRRPNTQISIYGTYTFNNEQRFCDGDTAILVGPPPPIGETHNYQWLLAGTPLIGETNDTLLVTGSGPFSVRVTLGLCDAVSNDTIVNAYTPPALIFYSPGPGITPIGLDSIQFCEGTVATLNGVVSPNPPYDFKYQWFTDSVDLFGKPVLKPLLNDTLSSLSVTESGLYYISVLEANGGCIDTSTFFYVFVDTLPSTTIANVKWPWQTFPTLNLCPEDSTLLLVSDTSFYPSWQYQWQISYPVGSAWQDIPNDTLPGLVVSAKIVADTAEYRLVTQNATCSFTSNSLIVNFIDNPVFQFFPADSVATCAGDSILVQLVGNGLQYVWADGFIGSNRWMTTAGTYPVRAIGINQCETWDTLKVGIFTVTANAGPDQTIVPGQSAQLNGSGGVSYFWYANLPAYFNNQFIANPLTQPTADTTLYFVQVTGPNGCVGIDSVWVWVVDTAEAPGRLANIQNVITPNNDGRNDFLDISEILDGDVCELTILNRWGAEVYYNPNYINNWNGETTGGAELPDGTYYFIVKFKDEIRFKGPVTIIRNSK
jgi:gliding motility-associated-like protein